MCLKVYTCVSVCVHDVVSVRESFKKMCCCLCFFHVKWNGMDRYVDSVLCKHESMCDRISVWNTGTGVGLDKCRVCE